jgi:inner membrane protein
MMALTHIAIGAVAASFAIGPTIPAIGLAIAGTQIPDLDTTKSWVGSVFFPVSRWIESRYPHRTVTHSLILSVALLAVGWLLSLLLPDLLAGCWYALAIGHASACFADSFTKKGVQLFWPKSVWCVCGINPNRRLSTGSVGEYFVLASAIALLIVNIQFSTSGGWMRTVTQGFGLREGAIETYNQEAGKRHVFAEVKGVWVSDRTRADGRYWILGTDQGEFVLTNGKGIYKTASNLVTERLSAKPEGQATTITKTLSFSDNEPQQQLQQLVIDNPQSAIYLSGNITIDFPEEIPQSTKANEFQTFSLSGNQALLNYCPIDLALIQLQGQYATGTITAKIISPKPQL